MITLTEPVDEALFAGFIRVGRWRWRWRIFRHFLHLLSETERSHIRPYFFDESQTLGFQPDFSYPFPAGRHFLVVRPNRILFLMIQNYSIYSCVLFIWIVPTHFITSVMAPLRRWPLYDRTLYVRTNGSMNRVVPKANRLYELVLVLPTRSLKQLQH